MTVADRKSLRQDFTGFFAGLAGMILSGLISVPDTGSLTLDLRWINAIILAYLMKSPAVIAGILLGIPISAILILPTSPFPSSGIEAFGQITSLTVSITLSSIVIRKKLFTRTSMLWMVMIAILCVTGFWVLHAHGSNVTLAFYGACILTGCLACMKNSRLASLPSTFFIAWACGYVLWGASIAMFGLDPSATWHEDEFIRRNWLMPFPLNVLLILIAVHLIHAFTGSDDNSSNQ